MIKRTSLIFIAGCLLSLTPLASFAEAPVIEESENYALLDNASPSFDEPDVQVHNATADNGEEYALAKDDDNPRANSNVGKNVALVNKIQGLQQELQELRGQLEVQAHEIKQLQQQQLSFYKDLDARIRHTAPNASAVVNSSTQNSSKNTSISLENTAPKSNNITITPANNTANHSNPADEQISYLAAYELIKNKKFDDALTSMQGFVKQYPQGAYTANAEYWLGELYMVKKAYPEAIKHFEVVLEQFPTSSKSAASLLKSGYAYAAQGNKAEAIVRLQQVIKSYPDTNTAQLAKAKLDTIHP